jgi:hypothetical protein
MKFDITKSRLYGEIMSALASFFKLGDDATETDIHAALEGQRPLDEQLEAAKADAVRELQAKFDAMKSDFDAQTERISALEKAVAEAAASAALKDDVITLLQAEITGNANAVEALKAQHKAEIEALAGQLAAAKAGKALEQSHAGDAHEAAKLKYSNGSPVVVARASALDQLLRQRS